MNGCGGSGICTNKRIKKIFPASSIDLSWIKAYKKAKYLFKLKNNAKELKKQLKLAKAGEITMYAFIMKINSDNVTAEILRPRLEKYILHGIKPQIEKKKRDKRKDKRKKKPFSLRNKK